ncbi:MAG TPA: peptide chain release factor 1, partial [Firmicutes bacterium]|nr:peptide chain release factor 1 [Bacillota bacterium]
MFDKLANIKERYDELTKLVSDPDMISRQNEWRELMKEQASLS